MYGVMRALVAMALGFGAVVALAHAFTGAPALRVTELRQAADRVAEQPLAPGEPRPVGNALVFSTTSGVPVIVCIKDGGAGAAAIVPNPSRPPQCDDGQLTQ